MPPHESKGALVKDPDLAEAAELMNLAWARPCWRYTQAMLSDYLHRGTGDRQLSVAWSKGGRMLGFFAGVPIEVRGPGGLHRAIFTSFMTVHPEAKDPVMPMRLFSSVLETARSGGATHVYTVFHHDEATNRFVRRLFQLAGCEAHDLMEFVFLTRPVSLRKRANDLVAGRVVGYEPRRAQALAALLARTAARAPLAQVMGEQDLGSVCTSEVAIVRLVLRGDDVAGFVVGRLRDVLNVRTMRNLHLDVVCIDGLSAGEQDSLLAAVARAAADSGVDAIVAPELGYFDATVLLRNGFLRFTSEAVLAVAELGKDVARMAPVAGAFFEVY